MTGRPKGATDNELIEAVEEQCEIRDIPVVKTEHVVEAPSVDIGQKRVHDRLKQIHEKEGRVGRMKVSTGSVWWVPEEADVDISSSSINWERIEAEEIPEEKIEQHPDYQSPTYWEAREETASKILNPVSTAMVVGFLMFISREVNIPLVSANAEETVVLLGALSLVGAFAFGIYAVGMIGLSQFAQQLVARGADEVYTQYKTKLRMAIKNRVPISISWKEE